MTAGLDPVDGSEHLTAANQAAERIYLGLRTSRGMVLKKDEVEATRAWVEAGWAGLVGSHLTLTPTGWLRLDALAVALANVERAV